MEITNDSTATSTETVEETGTQEVKADNESSSDLTELKSLIETQANDIASLKRSLKKATKETKTDTPEKTTDNSDLVQKYDLLLMKQEGLQSDSEQQLAQKLQSETNLPMEKLLSSKYFKAELEELRTAETNANATTGIKGDKSSTGDPKQSAEYWIAKGEYPSREQVPDREVRKKIRENMKEKASGLSGKFYNS